MIPASAQSTSSSFTRSALGFGSSCQKKLKPQANQDDSGLSEALSATSNISCCGPQAVTDLNKIVDTETRTQKCDNMGSSSDEKLTNVLNGIGTYIAAGACFASAKTAYEKHKVVTHIKSLLTVKTDDTGQTSVYPKEIEGYLKTLLGDVEFIRNVSGIMSCTGSALIGIGTFTSITVSMVGLAIGLVDAFAHTVKSSKLYFRYQKQINALKLEIEKTRTKINDLVLISHVTSLNLEQQENLNNLQKELFCYEASLLVLKKEKSLALKRAFGAFLTFLSIGVLFVLMLAMQGIIAMSPTTLLAMTIGSIAVLIFGIYFSIAFSPYQDTQIRPKEEKNIFLKFNTPKNKDSSPCLKIDKNEVTVIVNGENIKTQLNVHTANEEKILDQLSADTLSKITKALQNEISRAQTFYDMSKAYRAKLNEQSCFRRFYQKTISWLPIIPTVASFNLVPTASLYKWTKVQAAKSYSCYDMNFRIHSMAKMDKALEELRNGAPSYSNEESIPITNETHESGPEKKLRPDDEFIDKLTSSSRLGEIMKLFAHEAIHSSRKFRQGKLKPSYKRFFQHLTEEQTSKFEALLAKLTTTAPCCSPDFDDDDFTTYFGGILNQEKSPDNPGKKQLIGILTQIFDRFMVHSLANMAERDLRINSRILGYLLNARIENRSI